MSGLGTVWRGSAFNCANRNNEIFLLDNNFGSMDGNPLSECNNGAITGQVIGVEEGFYTSQLSVTVSSDLIGKTIECAYDNGSGSTELEVIGSSAIGITTVTGVLRMYSTFSVFIMIMK